MGPREEIARAIYAAWAKAEDIETTWDEVEDRATLVGYLNAKKAYALITSQAQAALNVLRSHGYITNECLAAIHAEEDAAGEPRSTIERFRTK